MKLKLLFIYFIVIQLFGILFGAKEYNNISFSIVYLFFNFPVFGLIYNVNIWTLSSSLEKKHQKEYDKIAFKNPFTRENRVITPGSLFSIKTEKVWPEYVEKIALTKWSFILMILSFIVMIPINILAN